MLVKKYSYLYGIEVLAFFYTTASSLSFVDGIANEVSPTASTEGEFSSQTETNTHRHILIR